MIKVCAYCGKEFNSRRSKFKFCSHECGNRSRWTEDESVFQNGIGPEEAYIIGFICADGCISYDAHSGRYRITIATKDKELIEYFHRRMTPNKSIYFSKGCYSIVSNNRFDIEFLKQLGIWERKTSVFSMPVIDKSLISHLIRGYFDGDGCAYKSTTTQKAYSKTYTYTYVSFTTGSYESALDVQCLFQYMV
jgi:intein-encoded DNA endonuclease-like protein